MSADPSFFDVHYKITFFIVFTGVLFVTLIAPMNVLPGSIVFPKYVKVCELSCYWVEIPFNSFWSGLINGAVYGVLGAMGYLGIRWIGRKLKK
ncbi:MAG: hypothetical protein ACTSSC_08465 [Promethearchaeota archaeon]